MCHRSLFPAIPTTRIGGDSPPLRQASSILMCPPYHHPHSTSRFFANRDRLRDLIPNASHPARRTRANMSSFGPLSVPPLVAGPKTVRLGAVLRSWRVQRLPVFLYRQWYFTQRAEHTISASHRMRWQALDFEE